VVDEELKPEGAGQDVEGVVDIEVRPELTAGDPSGDRGRRPGAAVSEEPAAELLGQLGVALRLGDDLPDELPLP
jgi:hypothetical protein